MMAAGILPICTSTKRVLLSKRHPHVMYPNSWASWGGKFEKELGDVTPQDCAKREFWEETRIAEKYLFLKRPVHIYEDERVLYYTFIGFFEHEPTPDILAEGGLADYAWFKLDELPEPLMPEFEIMMQEEMHILKEMVEKGTEEDAEWVAECEVLVRPGVTTVEADHPISVKKMSLLDLLFHKKNEK